MRAEAALLQQYRHLFLLSELEAWERLRAETPAPPYEPPPHANARTVIVLDGIPGAGKSTTQAWLQPATGASYLSMARFASAPERNVSAEARMQHQRATAQPHPVDEAFLEGLAAGTARYVLLEKFPRTVIEALTLLKAAARHGWRLEVLHLQLPSDSVALSTQRQLERGPKHGEKPTAEHARHRALVHLARATSGREVLRHSGVPIHALDMTRPKPENEAAIRSALGLDPKALGWHRGPLEKLARIAERVGVPAWVSCGAVYRPFWNNRYGPAQLPSDLDVAVDEARDVERLHRALSEQAPEERWSVLAPSERLRQRYGLATHSAAEAKSYATFLHRSGLVRLHEGELELTLPPGAEASLWSGTIERNPAAPATEQELHHVERALKDYPGLQVKDSEHEPKRIGATWRALKKEVLKNQRPSRQKFCRRALGAEEKEIAKQILQFHEANPKTAEPPPLPRRGEGRGEGDLLQRAKEEPDEEFSNWIQDQTHHHRPRGGPDRYLQELLTLKLFKKAVKGVLNQNQSAMHQGWHLERHLAQSAQQLQTDDLVSKLEPRHGKQWCRDLRLSMRLAMLFHDTGKLLGQRPRRHAEISAKLFARLKPSGFPEHLVPLTKWLIRTHDLFGAFGRGLTEKIEGLSLSLATSYFGALDSQAVRAILLEPGLPLEEATAINKQIWSADVGSIAALRWLLPVAELVERLLLVRQRASNAGDRRKPVLPRAR